jgi:hypothetical protein
MRRSVSLLAILVLATGLVACSSDDKNSDDNPVPVTSYAWREVLPPGNGGFPPGSGNAPEWEEGKFPLALKPTVAFGGALWMVSQEFAYSSPDGIAWTQHDKTDWRARIYSSTVFFHDKLWSLGGLDYDTRSFLNDVWSSADGSTWTNEGFAPWSARGNHALVVFDDKMWLLGGADHVADDRSTDRYLNDVWSSPDGLAWQRVTEAAPWSARDDMSALVFDDAIYLVGGAKGSEVWKSEDGVEWTQVTAAAPWGARQFFGIGALGGQLWLFGGFAGKPGNVVNDVWVSADGATWTQATEHAPWSPRAPVSTVFQDKIWIYSGQHAGAADNWGGDLWQLAASAP